MIVGNKNFNIFYIFEIYKENIFKVVVFKETKFFFKKYIRSL